MSRQPLAVCWGMGQDSTGMLVGMWERLYAKHQCVNAAAAGEAHALPGGT